MSDESPRRRIRPDHAAYVIAEIGSNHNRDEGVARELIDVAAEAGCQAVKFQVFRGSDIAGPEVPAVAYGRADWNEGKATWREVLDGIALPLDWLERLFTHARGRGLEVVSTPESPAYVGLLRDLELEVFKVASMDLDYLPLHRALVDLDRPVILSTGMATAEEADRVTAFYRERDRYPALLHCISQYPTRHEQALLHLLWDLHDRFPENEIGLSDHSEDNYAAAVAAYRGVRLFEKHITLDKSMPGPDHAFSLEPAGLIDLVHAVRAGHAMRAGESRGARADQAKRSQYRRSLRLARPIEAGETLNEDDLECLRPGTGLSPWRMPEVTGRRLARDLPAGHVLAEDDLEP